MSAKQIRRYQGAVTVLAIYSIFTTSIVASSRRFASAPPESRTIALNATVAEQQLNKGSFRDSVRDGKLQLIIWTDYRCPFCERLEHALDSSDYIRRGMITVRLRQFPLNIHPAAPRLAELAACSDRFAEFPQVHRTLFEQQFHSDSLSDHALLLTARVAKTDEIENCVRTGGGRDLVAQDIAAALKLSVNSTPTMVFGRTMQRGALGAAQLDSMFRSAGIRDMP